MYTIIQHFLTKNDCYKANRRIKPVGIMVHSTGANNPYMSRYVGPNKNNNDWNRPGIKKCVHAFIGKDADGNVGITQTLPWNWRGWHAGGAANNTHIGFEICEDDLQSRVYFEQVYEAAVELCAMLCKEYDINPATGIICHSEGHKAGIASGHADVMHWFPCFGKDMDDFRLDVYNKVHEPEKEVKTVYDSVERCPEWARDTVTRLIDCRALTGTGTGKKDKDGRPADLGLTHDMLRLLVIIERGWGIPGPGKE